MAVFRTSNMVIASITAMALGCAVTASAQDRPPDPSTQIAAQRDAMHVFKAMDGTWRGPAWVITPTGEKSEFIQTERIGPFLDGSVKVIEGRGHAADGAVKFNSLGVISYNSATRAYTMRSHALGMVGDFTFNPTPDGFMWQIPAGPASIRYTATIKDGTLVEVGDRIVSGKEPVRIFEMHLKRIGDTDWPAAGAIGPR